ncbi:MAG: glutamate-5-semialdehyde dehydrogenase [Clostridia bacterium]|nr:glutamate-5-semialdehyde dehydrogenase [Clostridia bacterium]
MFNVEEVAKKARYASYSLAVCSADTKNKMLECIAKELVANADGIIEANKLDVEALDESAKVFKDRLMLNESRIAKMAEGLYEIIKLEDPVGEVTASWKMYNGIEMRKTRSPLGVIGVIYEARPNVTIDVAGLCVKSGNAVILRGGKEAINSNRALYNVIKNALESNGFDPDIVGFIDDTSRESSKQMLSLDRYVDVIIPRGGDGLKKFVLSNATMPVIASAGGNCHIYIEKSADINMAREILENAKMSRPTVCNACEQLLIDSGIVEKLPYLVEPLIKGGCKIKGDKVAAAILNVEETVEEDYYEEHLDYYLTVKTVNSHGEAIDWINEHGTKHSEAIVTKDTDIADEFTRKVDAGAVYVNASTRFTDGFEFGFGAEIGISTQKLHARGPLGLKQLTSEKYIAIGTGQVRK